GLIMVRISGFGQTGPYKERPGFGAIGESMGGMRYITGYADRAPVRVGISIGDSLADDPVLASNDGRARQTERIDAAIEQWTRGHDLETVLQILEKAEVPSGRIYSIKDIAADMHYRARDMIERHRIGEKDLLLPGIVPKLSETPGETRWIGPRLGEHTDDVLREA